MLPLWSIGRQQQNANTVSSELAFHCNLRSPAFWKRNAERQNARLDMEVHGAGQRQGANLKLLVKGSKDGLPLSDLQLSHLLLHGCHLSSHCTVLLPCIIQTPGMLPQHLHSMHLHSMLLHLMHLHSMQGKQAKMICWRCLHALAFSKHRQNRGLKLERDLLLWPHAMRRITLRYAIRC